MSFTVRLNNLLKSSGIVVEATWVHALQRYDVWCQYHTGRESNSVLLNNVCRDVEYAALEIVDRILCWESR